VTTQHFSLHVNAPRALVYRALLDARAVARWRVPPMMTSEVHQFDPREGGAFRISLTYRGRAATGKTTAHTDTYHGHFAKLVPDALVVEVLEFETVDRALQGSMTITFVLADADGGTDVQATHAGLPASVPPADNALGWEQSLAQLAAYVEAQAGGVRQRNGQMGTTIRVGTAGWDYPDWRGIVYPNTKKTKSFDELAYLARFFDTVEINTTFYGPGSPKTAADWVARVADNPEFKFTAKLWRRFTHQRETAFSAEEVKTARAAFDILQRAGRLGAVLLQFPWSFKRDAAAEEWLRDLGAAFAELPLVLEVRHASWNSEEVLAELTERGVGIVNVDQPLFENSLRPAARATSSVGYVRMHGRNYQEWFRKTADRNARYDYLYTANELRPWVERIKEIAARPTTKEMYAVTNNHHLGKAPANGAMITGMLRGRKVPVPETLFARYPAELGPFAAR
jgi:uncharacterized protein YecE (DUF72 family)/uncharacterized protein YndB with AHSA1/START domain